LRHKHEASAQLFEGNGRDVDAIDHDAPSFELEETQHCELDVKAALIPTSNRPTT
jgi:hypothetical protein